MVHPTSLNLRRNACPLHVRKASITSKIGKGIVCATIVMVSPGDSAPLITLECSSGGNKMIQLCRAMRLSITYCSPLRVASPIDIGTGGIRMARVTTDHGGACRIGRRLRNCGTSNASAIGCATMYGSIADRPIQIAIDNSTVSTTVGRNTVCGFSFSSHAGRRASRDVIDNGCRVGISNTG